MAKIFGLELKNIKSDTGVLCSELYLDENKIGNCYFTEKNGRCSVDWDKDVNTESVYYIIEDYFKECPKYLSDYSRECKLTEILKELLNLYENEKYLINRKINYPDSKIVYVAYNKRIEQSSKLADWLCVTNWSKKLEDRIINNYNPMEFIIYSNEEDFIIKKCS